MEEGSRLLLYFWFQAAELLELGQFQIGCMALQMRVRLDGGVHVHVASLGGTLKALVLEQLVVTAGREVFNTNPG